MRDESKNEVNIALPNDVIERLQVVEKIFLEVDQKIESLEASFQFCYNQLSHKVH